MTKKMGSRLLGTTVLLSGMLVLTSEGLAFAQLGAPPKPAAAANATANEEGEKANDEGQRKFDAGDYQGALEQFRRLDTLLPGYATPKEKIALCHDKLGNVEEAIAAYELFVSMAKAEKFAERVARAKARITELQAIRPGVVLLAVSPSGLRDLAATVDGAPQQGTELRLAPGEHVVVVSAERCPAVTKHVTVQAGSKQTVAFELVPQGAAPGPATGVPATPPGEGGGAGGEQIAGGVLVGLGAVGLVVGTVFGVRAINAKSDFDAAPNHDDASKQKTSALVSDISLGTGIAAAGVGVVLLVLGVTAEGEPQPADESAQPPAVARPAVAPYATPYGGGVAAVWAF